MPRHSRLTAIASAAGLAVVLAAGALTFGAVRSQAEALNKIVPAPSLDEKLGAAGTETLILAGGCFWGVQGVFQHVHGVTEAMSGYDGGSAANAQYETVSTGTTGHAESVRITYDPKIITYGKLLQIYFSVATDPTQVNQQYPDTGSQYRSEIFATTPEQAAIAHAYIAQLNQSKTYAAPVATIVGQNTGFYPAEGYHQNYLTLHPDSDYIATFDLPKVGALQKLFPTDFSAQPILVTGIKSS
ncbi:peptide-methionine (S)-S-oxide reductase MsrA [Acidisoma cellulosilytica]|uniref:Peptide methionine sulfoxide reductase MsrA n=1 Tax=Acidisoma cellulosilyticum TaxID=2802395 RepID=A0A963Z3B0_9PROT|nr:peptide-methionine (S)-S-oxide reductase MsrA [Acidisoma cellulosilyticum]MCB8881202.1 peptide-methionine (S)-S-oxide reductase MsrA [Acidisoma cellulosilyticum]